MTIETLGKIFTFLGGLGLFLYGMNLMAEGLQKSAGAKMKQLLAMLTNNRLMGVFVGAGVTAIIQSSSATTVMIVGFVNAGLMNLGQAVGVIMGANIGTTVTAWIVSMSDWTKILQPDFIAPIIIAIGAFVILFSNKPKRKQVAEILLGFGILFLGLSLMGDIAKSLKDLPAFRSAFETFGSSPILGLLVGMVVTAIIQSSSASVGILQSLTVTGAVTWGSSVYILLGQNIGTCITAILASAKASKTAKSAAIIHLLFNVIGSVLFMILSLLFFKFIRPEMVHQGISKTGISLFHTFFNVANTIILFPFANVLVKIAEKFMGSKNDIEDVGEAEIALRHLDERILETPSFAVENAQKEVVHMGMVALENLKAARIALFEKNQDKIDEVFAREKDINKLQKLITEYLVKIENLPISEKQHQLVTNLFYSVGDIERVGDHVENIAELAQIYLSEYLVFSDLAKDELDVAMQLAYDTVEAAVFARQNEDMEMVRKVIQGEESMDDMEDNLRAKHISRLSQGICDTQTGIVFLDVLSNLERISDHSLNLAYYVKDEIV
ncbi:MAG: putative rane protein [Clostridiales bacterium]|nr:putative rane protein [Clostridiales bacterium]